jgi:hypothetical protein
VIPQIGTANQAGFLTPADILQMLALLLQLNLPGVSPLQHALKLDHRQCVHDIDCRAAFPGHVRTIAG